MRLSGRGMLVTGGGGGLGRAMAEGFAREGAAVAVTDVNLDAARAVALAIEERGGRALAIRMDVTSEDQVERGVADAVRALGRLDVAVSNAGVQHIAPITEFALEDWRRVLGIHLDGGFLLTRAAMRHWQSTGKGGLLLYMGSIHSLEASPLKAAYVTAKHGLMGLARAAAKEGAEDRRARQRHLPGFRPHPAGGEADPRAGEDLGISEEEVVKKVMLGSTVDGEFTTLEDIAQLAIDLAAFPSAALTGQLVAVSHGWHMH